MGTPLTGSALPILRRCGYGFRVDVEVPAQESGKAAERGTRLHDAISTGEVAKLAPDEQYIALVGHRWLEQQQGFKYVEKPFAVDLVTGAARELPSSGHRDYSDARVNEVAMTLDAVVLCPGGKKAIVIDWKSGFGAYVDRASENLQLLAGAYAVAQVFGVEEVELQLPYLDSEPFYVDRWTVGIMDLLAAWEEVRRLAARVPGSQPMPGEHCGQCKAVTVCPVTQQGVLALRPENMPAVKFTTEYLSEENEVALVLVLPAIERAVKAVRDSLKARAREREGGIPLPGGKVYKLTSYPRASFNTKKAIELLGEENAAKCRGSIEVEAMKVVKAKP